MAFETTSTLTVAMKATGDQEVKQRIDAVSAEMTRMANAVGKATDNLASSFQGMAKGAIMGLTGIGAVLSVTKFTSMIDGAISARAALYDLSLKTGVAVESLSALSKIGKPVGVSADDIGGAMNRLSKNLAGADEDAKGAAQAIKALGLDFNKLRSESPDQQMLDLAKAFNHFEDSGEKSAAAMMLFGRQGAELLPFMKKLGEQTALNGAVTAEAAAQAKRYEEGLAALQKSGEAWKATLINGILPALFEVDSIARQAGAALSDYLASGAKEAGGGFDVMRGAIQVLTPVIETLAVVGSDVAFTFKTIGQDIGAAAAAASLLAKGDLSGASAIVSARSAEAAQAREALDQFQARMLRLTDNALQARDALSRFGLTTKDGTRELNRFNEMSGNVAQKLHIQAKAGGAAAGSVEDLTKTYGSLIAASRAHVAEMEAQELGADKLTTGEKKLLEMQAKIEAGTLTYNSALYKATAAEYQLEAAREKRQRREEALSRALIEAVKAHESDIAALRNAALQAEEQAKAEREGVNVLGLSRDAIAVRNAARLEEQATMVEMQAIKRVDRDLDMEAYDLAIRQARAYRDRAAAMRQGAELERAEQAGKAAEELAKAQSEAYLNSWRDTTNTIQSMLETAITAGGKDGWKAVRKEIETNAVRALINWASSGIAGGILGGTGGGAGGSSAGGMNSLSTLNSLYGAGQKGWNWLTGSNGMGGFTSQGSYLLTDSTGAGLSGMDLAADAGSQAIGSGGQLAATSGMSAASWIPIVGWIVAAVMASKASYEGGATMDMLGDRKYATPGGILSDVRYDVLSSLGMSDKWAQILSGGPLVSRLIGHKASSSGYGVGAYSGGSFVTDPKRPFEFGDNTLNTGVNTDLQDLAKDIATALAMQAGSFGGKLQDGLRVGAFTDSDREGKVSALLGFLSGNKLLAGAQTGSGTFGAGGPGVGATKIEGDQLQQWFATQMPVLMIQGLQQSDLAPRFKEYFDSIAVDSKLTSDKASEYLKTASAVKLFSDAFSPLGGMFARLQDASVNTVTELTKAAGGFDAATQSVSAYYQAYYSEAERTQIATDSVTKALADVGLTMPDLTQGTEAAHAAFRALVDAQDETTDSGRKAWAQLMGVSGVFDQLALAADAAAKKEQERLAAIADKRTDLEIDLLRAQGDEMGAVRRERERELESLRKMDPALASVRVSIFAAIDAAKAQEAAAKAAADAAAKLKQVQAGVDSVIGDFAGGRDLANYFGGRIGQILGEAGITSSLGGILGSTKQDILDLWRAVGDDGKLAIETAYSYWLKLQDVLLQTSKVADSTADLLAAYNEINPAAETLVGKWRKSREEMLLLQQALDQIDGTPARTKLGQLQDLISKQNGLAGIQDNLIGLIDDARTSKGDQAALNYARLSEQNAAAQFAVTNSPQIAQQWIAWTQKRIQLEGELQAKATQDRYDAEYKAAQEAYEIAKQTDTLLSRQQREQRDALQAQIDGYQRLKELAKTIPEVLGNIRAGDLSVLGVPGRLAEREKLYQRALDTGNDPAGALEALLRQAQQVWGGGTTQYGQIYYKAMADYEAKVSQGAIDADALLPAAVRQVNELQKIADRGMPELKKAVVDVSDAQISALTGINTAITSGLGSLTTELRTLYGSAVTETSALAQLIEQWAAPYLTPAGPTDENWMGGSGSGGGYGGAMVEALGNVGTGFDEAITAQTTALRDEFVKLRDEVVGLREDVKTLDTRTAMMAGELGAWRKERKESADKSQGSLDRIARNTGRVPDGSRV